MIEPSDALVRAVMDLHRACSADDWSWTKLALVDVIQATQPILPATPDRVAVVDAMEKAYAETTGVSWANLHINHRAGLSAAMVAGLKALGFEVRL